jgi:hypothetical protein
MNSGTGAAAFAAALVPGNAEAASRTLSDSCACLIATQNPFCCEDMMRRHTFLAFVCIFFLATAGTVFGQAGCNFNIAGDWEATAPGHVIPDLYRFTSDGTVTVFSVPANGEEQHKLGSARYRLEDAQTSKTLEFKSATGTRAFPWGTAKLEINQVDHTSFTTVSSGQSTTWVKKDPNQYYVVLGAHRGTPPHQGGPAFAMLIKTGEVKPVIETFGLFYRDGERINGPIPDDLYQRFTSDSLPADDAVLRLEISSQAFDRAMKVMRNWQERAREGTLLFPSYSYLNVIVPMRDIAESLNECGGNFRIYQLTWMLDDELGANVPQWELAFAYVKRLREMNEQSNISNVKFQQNNTSRLALPLPKN